MLLGRLIALSLLLACGTSHVSAQPPQPTPAWWVTVEVASRDAGVRAHATYATVRLLRAIPDVAVVPPGAGAGPDYRVRIIAGNPHVPDSTTAIYSLSVVIEDVSPSRKAATLLQGSAEAVGVNCEDDAALRLASTTGSLDPDGFADTREWTRVVEHILIVTPVEQLEDNLQALIERFAAQELEPRRLTETRLTADR